MAAPGVGVGPTAPPGDAPDKKRPPTTHGSGTRFSGAPLWRFSLRRDEQRRQQEQEYQRQGVPDGFIRHTDGFFWHPQQRVFWKSSNQKYYLYNEANQAYTEIRSTAGKEWELRMIADASSVQQHEGVREDRHVIVKDLAKAAHALRMPIEHLARPVALFALYDGHKPTVVPSAAGNKEAATSDSTEDQAPACAEFCARTLHKKLLARLTDFKGDWGDEQVAAALRSSCEDVDTEYLTKGPGSRLDGCSAVIVLLTGEKIFVAGLGEAVGFLMEDGDQKGSAKVTRQTNLHAPLLPAEVNRIRSAGGEVLPAGPSGRPRLRKRGHEESLTVTRAFGNRAFKATAAGGLPDTGALLIPTPDVRTAGLHQGHRFLLLACGEVTSVLKDEEIADILQKRAGRPRMACSAIVQEAQQRGATGSLTVLCVCLDWSPHSSAEPEEATKQQDAPQAKRPKTADGKAGTSKSGQVRCRQILVRHKHCKEPVDRVRGNKPITRSLAEAERILFEAIVAIEGSPGKSVFTQRCKAVSECSTSLKGGELAGDLGWISKGQCHPAVEAAAFA
eukprot:CAMPEP_0178393410 /NCGR_PEP_ID=MMETSP0689_2-20121128/12171_1 /TAXON_ID=160604 /ORGANISM="Amphidinium massartii, Strain CS-259" /LENGTH=559 /DNA_ID=CAMNT_0020013997 /DNA_START=19 /DNA_END=1695 /DNA_ORIENTATION=+